MGLPCSFAITKPSGGAEFRDWLSVVIRTFELDPQSAAEIFTGMCQKANCIPFLARIEDQPVATSLLFPGKTGAGVYCVATLESFRRRGLGAALTRACLLEASALGCRKASLFASPLGRSVYETLGFRALKVLREHLLHCSFSSRSSCLANTP